MPVSIPTRVRPFVSAVALACTTACLSDTMDGQPPRPVRLVVEQTIVGDGAVNPDATMNEARSLAVLPDGSLLVSEPERILQFSAKGDFVRTIGRRGSGPGEFRRIDKIGVSNDSLWVVDQTLKRVSWMQWGRPGARIDQFPEVGSNQLGFFYQPLGAGFGISKRWSTDTTAQIRLVIHATGGNEMKVLSQESRGASGSTLTLPFGKFAVPQPFATSPLFAVSPNGQNVALVLRDDSVLASRGGTLVRLYRANGTLSREFTVTMPPRRTSGRMRDSVVDAIVLAHTRVAPGGKIDESALRAAVRRTVKVPAVVPAFRDVLATDAGNLWLQLSGPPDSWRIVGRAGEVLGDVSFPPRTIVKLAGENNVWVLNYDKDDVPVLRLYRLEYPR